MRVLCTSAAGAAAPAVPQHLLCHNAAPACTARCSRPYPSLAEHAHTSGTAESQGSIPCIRALHYILIHKNAGLVWGWGDHMIMYSLCCTVCDNPPLQRLDL